MTPTPARCDRIVNNGMGEPTECGRTLPCEVHDAPRTAAGRTYEQLLNSGRINHNGKSPKDYILAIEAEAAASAPTPTEPLDVHPRTYSLVGSPHLFLVTDDESGMVLGYADKIGGPLVEPLARPDTPASAEQPGLREAIVQVLSAWDAYSDDPRSLTSVRRSIEALADTLAASSSPEPEGK